MAAAEERAIIAVESRNKIELMRAIGRKLPRAVYILENSSNPDLEARRVRDELKEYLTSLEITVTPVEVDFNSFEEVFTKVGGIIFLSLIHI